VTIVKNATILPTSSKHYAEAYEKQYATKDLHAALLDYKDIVTEYPDTKEAGYSRSQIQNIVRAVVPEAVLKEVQLKLALDYSGNNEVPDDRTVGTTSPVPESAVR
jgi:hypothetical protein